ncbi:hypothetical protein CNI04180 [Cryptococcus gattii WM276]|uniref:RanBP2-type domain-containing protein n=2 Tax=Cryptococcus gattii TaxID=37769 RepID=E6RB08_CRYGW|nr:uncharacterized protein CGB_H3690C [Cryptococcus gattii WM276]ADV23987.1 hypothetical protein CNI04180 [Cryptococcus gattii WM276]KIR81345.1 hypothetical protein I306_01579 [Cryptococcus gattii EJB2]KJE03903.1 hypothetical protein I311_02362 [Cryptococcus gattii NT-10]
MDSSRSSQQGKRSERLTRTPYARPTPQKTRGTPNSALGAIKSALSLFTSPFSRSPSTLPTHNDIEVDQRSESGSEDNWDGEAPITMKEQDVFSLAAAAGRSGEDFEGRQIAWRSKGEVPGSKHDVVRRGLQLAPPKTSIGIQNGQPITPNTPIFPGHFNRDGAASQTGPSHSKRALPAPLVPTSGILKAVTDQNSTTSVPAEPKSATPSSLSLPSRLPLPASFMTPTRSAIASASSSQCALALSSFLDDKQGKVLTSEDRTIIEALSARIAVEENASPAIQERRGGWLPSSTSGEVAFRGNLSQSSSSSSLGSGTPYKQRYLGPGMSPKKMPSSRSSPASSRLQGNQSNSTAPIGPDSSALPPSFPNRHLVNTILRYSATSSPLRQSYRPGAPSIPAAAAPEPPASSPATDGKRKPESSADPAITKRRQIEAAGRQRATAIMQSLIEETDSTTSKPGIEPVRWNAYDRGSLHAKATEEPSAGPSTPVKQVPAVPISTPSTAHAGSTPRKRTPLRGAAAKLEAHRQAMKGAKPLSTIERIKGVRPWENGQSSISTPAHKNKEPEPQVEEPEESEVDELDSERDTDAADISEVEDTAKARKRATPLKPTEEMPQPSKIPDATKFEPFPIQPISFSSSSISKPAPSSPAPAAAENYNSPLRKSIIEAPKKAEESAKAFTFSFDQPTKPTSESETEPLIQPIVRSAVPKTSEQEKTDLSPKEAALKVDKLALPFFTFIPSAPTPIPANSTKEQTEKAKSEAAKSSPPTFAFKLEISTPIRPSSAPSSSAVKPANGGKWTCSMCMLENPESATEKCTICEEPRSKKSAPAAPAISGSSGFGGFGAPKTGGNGGKWTCSMCMLENPDSAKEKCQICEEPRPQSTKTASTAAVSTPFTGWGTGAQQKKQAGGSWTCSTCMLQNPDSAKDKCTICEAPRPK